MRTRTWGLVATPFVVQAMAGINALRERRTKYQEALELATAADKPLLVIGQPRGRHPCGDVCVDAAGCPECDTESSIGFQVMVEDLWMFNDKVFGAAFASHVLEHVEDLDLALQEIRRVSDHLLIAGPKWYRLVSYVNPLHKRNVPNWGKYEF